MEPLAMRPVASWEVRVGDDGRPYWSGGGVDDKDRTDLDPGAALTMWPSAFRPGTVVTGTEPVEPNEGK